MSGDPFAFSFRPARALGALALLALALPAVSYGQVSEPRGADPTLVPAEVENEGDVDAEADAAHESAADDADPGEPAQGAESEPPARAGGVLHRAPESHPEEEEASGAVGFASLAEGVGVRSADDGVRLRISPLLAVRGTLAKPDGQDVEGEGAIRLARVVVVGHLAQGLFRYFLQWEMAGTVQLLDLELTLALMPELWIRVGRIRTPFSRQFISPLFAMQLPLRSIVSDYSRADRDTGITVEGRAFGERFEYRLGVYDESLTVTPMVVGRLGYDPLGPFPYDETLARKPGPTLVSVGVSAYRGGRQTEQQVVVGTEVVTETGPEVVQSAIGIDAALRVGPVGATAEAFLDQREDTAGGTIEGAGAFVQAGVFVLPGLLEVTGRYDWLTPDRDASLRGLQRGELGATLYFFEARLKLQTSYVYTAIDAPVAGLVQAAPGHLVDLQALFVL